MKGAEEQPPDLSASEDIVSVSSSVQAATPSATASDDQSTSDSAGNLDQLVSAEIEGKCFVSLVI